MKRIFYILLAAGLLAGCSQNGEEKTGSTSEDTILNRSDVKVTQVAGIGKVEPEKSIIRLAAKSGGIVSEVYINEGDSIREGDPLLQLDNELELLKTQQIRSQHQAQKILRDIAELDVREAGERFDNRSRLLASAKTLVEKGAETQQNLDDLDTEVKTLGIALEKSKSELMLSQVRLDELSVQLKIAETELSRKTICSPFNGLMLEMLVEKGTALNQFDDLAVIAPEGRTIITAEIDELFAGRITEGLQAEIRFIGSEDPVATGILIFVSPYLKNKSLFSKKPAEQEDRLVREVKILLDNDANLIFNSKVECIIKL